MACGDFPKMARDRITIQQPNSTDTDTGGQDVKWIKLVPDTFAWVTPASGNQYYQNDKISSRVTHTMIIRYIPALADTDFAGKCRVLLDGKIMEIDYVQCLREDMKNYGKLFQRLFCIDNGPGNDG